MDFVMSKIGISLCALMTATVLGTVMAEFVADDRSQELRSIANRLCDAISSAALGYGDMVTTYSIPLLSTGEEVVATITVDGTIVSSGGVSAVDHPCTQVHLWHWDGGRLNGTAIADLDEAHPRMEAESGTTLEILTMTLLVEDRLQTLVFVAEL